jgi:hypothetical protein
MAGGNAMVFGGGVRWVTLLFKAQNGHTALIRTAMRGHADCMRWLVDVGSDKNATTNVRQIMSPLPAILFLCIQYFGY